MFRRSAPRNDKYSLCLRLHRISNWRFFDSDRTSSTDPDEKLRQFFCKSNIFLSNCRIPNDRPGPRPIGKSNICAIQRLRFHSELEQNAKSKNFLRILKIFKKIQRNFLKNFWKIFFIFKFFSDLEFRIKKKFYFYAIEIICKKFS